MLLQHYTLTKLKIPRQNQTMQTVMKYRMYKYTVSKNDCSLLYVFFLLLSLTGKLEFILLFIDALGNDLVWRYYFLKQKSCLILLLESHVLGLAFGGPGVWGRHPCLCYLPGYILSLFLSFMLASQVVYISYSICSPVPTHFSPLSGCVIS